ncbi:MAG: protein kinase [Candidatus Obscuribacterales bacterium]|nr:protein kinase [Candidatus Obscuribacterales bacterium]
MEGNRKAGKLPAGICKNCGKSLSQLNIGSLTSWLFQESVCQCGLTDRITTGKEPAANIQFGGDTSDLPFLGEAYIAQERIGKGGMGSVYRAVRTADNCPCAIKVLHEFLKDDEQAVRRFEQEASAVITLSHENLVKAFAWSTTPSGAPFLVMEFVEGDSLEQFLKKVTYIEAREAVDLFLQVCTALTFAHQHCIIHRDVKPGNIILTSSESGARAIKLVDFGIAKVRSLADRATRDLTQTGEVFGSPHYMSPEQCLGFELDSRSDIYSLGCVMYECLSGRPPFAGHNPVQLIAKHLSAELPPLRICESSMSAQGNRKLEEIVSRCLEKEPADRYFSVEILASELSGLIDENQAVPSVLPKKLRKPDLIRASYLLISGLSIFFGCMTFLPVEIILSSSIRLLLILPLLASILACLMISQRMREVVSRMQFQSSISRDSTSSSISVLSFCLLAAGLCSVAAIVSAIFVSSTVIVPILSAGLCSILAAVVWTSFQQEPSRREQAPNASSGRLLASVSMLLTVGLVAYCLNFQGQKDVVFDRKPVSNASPEKRMDEIFIGSLPKEYIENLGVNLEKPRISHLEKKGSRLMRVFNFPTGVNMGELFCRSAGRVPAAGTFELPADEKLSLRLSNKACSIYAPLLRSFASDDVDSLIVGTRGGELSWVENADDVMYYIADWTGLTSLNANDTDLSDFGLSKLKNCKKLQNLQVARTMVTPEGLCKLPQLRNLKVLNVGFIQGAEKVVSEIKSSEVLERLLIDNCSLKNADLISIAKFPNLEELNLQKNASVNEEGIKHLLGHSRLKYLSVPFTGITAKALPVLKKFGNLRTLHISDNGWRPKDLDALRQSLPESCWLRVSDATESRILRREKGSQKRDEGVLSQRE